MAVIKREEEQFSYGLHGCKHIINRRREIMQYTIKKDIVRSQGRQTVGVGVFFLVISMCAHMSCVVHQNYILYTCM